MTTPASPRRRPPTGTLDFVTTPLRGSERRSSFGSDPGTLVAGTPYERVRSLALRLTRDAAGNYQAVAAVERHLLENYTYEQEVPEHTPTRSRHSCFTIARGIASSSRARWR